MKVSDRNRISRVDAKMTDLVEILGDGIQSILRYADKADGYDFRKGVSNLVSVMQDLTSLRMTFEWARVFADSLLAEERAKNIEEKTQKERGSI